MRWFYEGLAGIDQEDSSRAYKNILIKPQYPTGIDEVKASFDSPYGLIKSHWKRTAGALDLSVEIPVNTTARILFPVADPGLIEEDDQTASEVDGLQFLGTESGHAVFRAGSGSYSFKIQLN